MQAQLCEQLKKLLDSSNEMAVEVTGNSRPLLLPHLWQEVIQKWPQGSCVTCREDLDSMPNVKITRGSKQVAIAGKQRELLKGSTEGPAQFDGEIESFEYLDGENGFKPVPDGMDICNAIVRLTDENGVVLVFDNSDCNSCATDCCRVVDQAIDLHKRIVNAHKRKRDIEDLVNEHTALMTHLIHKMAPKDMNKFL